MASMTALQTVDKAPSNPGSFVSIDSKVYRMCRMAAAASSGMVTARLIDIFRVDFGQNGGESR